MHPWAETAAEVAEFACGHGEFWKMQDLLFENQEKRLKTAIPSRAPQKSPRQSALAGIVVSKLLIYLVDAVGIELST
jgi:hypothetical protein